MWFVKSSLYGWNVIGNGWCRIALCKHILMAQIALNCLKFHFLIKSPYLACRKLGFKPYEVCPVNQGKNGIISVLKIHAGR